MAQHSHRWIDRSAMGLSGLCVVHCLAGSVLLAGLSATGGLWNHQVHAIGLALALPLAAFALIRGFRLHHRQSVAVLGGVGLALMAMSLAIAHGSFAEIAVSVTGVLALATAHLLNLRWSRT